MKQKLNNKGQALVEAVMVVTCVTIIIFATLQVCVIVVNQLSCNEAAFQVARSLCVAEMNGKDRSSALALKANATALILLRPFLSIDTLQFVPTGIETYEPTTPLGKDNEKNDITAYNVDFHYIVNTMFIRLIDPLSQNSYSYNGVNLLKQYTRARMVKSPDESYYTKAYKDADKFQFFDLGF